MEQTMGNYNNKKRGEDGMGRIIANRDNRQNWTAKISLSVVFTILFSICLTAGVFLPGPAQAAPITLCSDCHGYPPVDGTARNQPAGQFPGSHTIHSSTSTGHGYACTECHLDHTGKLDHRNGSIEMSLTTATTGTYSRGASFLQTNYTTTSAFGNCTNTKCHGVNSGTWGAAMTNSATCVKCHGVTSTPTTTYNAEPDRAAPGYVATTSPTGTGVNTAGITGIYSGGVSTDPKVGAHDVHLRGVGGYKTGGIACTDCHQAVTSVTDASHMSGTVNLPWSSLTRSGGLTPSYSGGQCNNTYCHGASFTVATQGTNTRPSWTVGTYLANSAAAKNSADCNKCHISPGNVATHGTFTIGSDCSGCHGHNGSSALHINGILEAAGSCVDCHDTGGSGAAGTRVAVVSQFSASSHHVQGIPIADTHCYNCHWEADSAGKKTSYHDGTAGGDIDLVVWTSTSRPAPASYLIGSTAVLYTGNTGSRGDLQNINKHCLGCHNNTNKTLAPFSGDTRTTARYAWDGSSVDSRYSSPTTTQWSKYSGANTVPKNQVKAYSAHGNAANNARGWNTAETYPNTSGAVNVLCFDCHNSHGSNAGSPTERTTSYISAASGTYRGGNLKETTSGKGGYSATYKPSSVTTGTWQPYDPGAGLCFDCHMFSAATTTVPWGYGPPASGGTFSSSQAILGYDERPYWGGSPSGTASTGNSGRQQRTAYKNTRGNVRGGHFRASTSLTNAAMGTIDGLCTPCHDPHGISPTDVGYCSIPGAVTRATCTGTWTASPQYGLPLLKGTWVTSPYKEDIAPATTNAVKGGGSRFKGFTNGSIPGRHIDQNTFSMLTDTIRTNTFTLYDLNTAPAASSISHTVEQFGGLCLQCHRQSNLVSGSSTTNAWTDYRRVHNAVQGWARTMGSNANNKTHGYTCSKCHSPHSSSQPRLAVTNCLDTNHRGRVASGGTTPVQNSTNTSSGGGNGRFPGGGGGFGCANSVKWKGTSAGGYYFGTAGTRYTPNGQFVTCHDGPAANNNTFTIQRWNSKTPW